MKIYLERFAQRIWMSNTYRDDIKNRAQSLPGSNWSKSGEQIAWARSMVGPRGYGAWTFPLTYRMCLDLRKEFGDEEIEIGKRLWDWAKRERQRRVELSQILAMKEMPTPRLEQTYPELAAALHARPFQSVGVGYLCRARRAILGDDPGLGKTLQASAAAVELGLKGPHLVLAPSSAVSITWPDEFGEWLPEEPFWIVEGSKAQRIDILQSFWDWTRDHPDQRAWLFGNIEMLQKERRPVPRKPPEGFNKRIWDKMEAKRLEEWDPDSRRFAALFEIVWSSAFIDESHRVLPTPASLPKDQSQNRSGAQKLSVMPSGLKLAMSGTPWRGNPLNNWGTLHWLFPEQFVGYWAYVDRWFDVMEEQYNREGATHKVIEGIRPEVEKEFGEELDSVMIRRRKSEVAKDLPAKQYGGTHLVRGDRKSPIGVWLPITGKQASAYEEMVENAIANLESGQLMATGILAELTRCKQLACSYGDIEQRMFRRRDRDTGEVTEHYADHFKPTLPSNKLDYIFEFLGERGITGGSDEFGEDKVVIASQYTTLINRYASELRAKGVEVITLTGETKTADRRKAKATFQADGGPRVFILNTDAGGTSLTLDAADDLIFVDEKWNPDDQTQVEDRIHRLSRMHQVRIWYLRSRGTIDERIALRTAAKDDVQLRLLDGRRGVDYAKQLLQPAA